MNCSQNTTVIGGVDSCIELISSVDGGRMVIDLEGPTCICAMANSSDHLFYTTMAKLIYSGLY